ncbi:hypothetical protein ACE106_17565 [Shouchella clausii]|uniref:hypothetical protein n=1 Tax=Shouchella clausii TaxID=79880 RepID=UPI00289FE65C|nr:hypothetical protein [Shouchella clausii]
MEHVPYGVRSCLYSGISKNIDFLTLQAQAVMDSGNKWKDYNSQLNNIKEALEWYKEHCVVSVAYLEEAMNKLELLINQVKE